MQYISLFSGIGTCGVALNPLGFRPLYFSETNSFNRDLLQQKYPGVKNLGDIAQINWLDLIDANHCDLIIGGSPCQSFSLAGYKKGLEDERGLLLLEFLRAIESNKPKWFIFENVPGICQGKNVKVFLTFLAYLSHIGYVTDWDILNTLDFCLPQRRRRIYTVGYLSKPPTFFELDRRVTIEDVKSKWDEIYDKVEQTYQVRGATLLSMGIFSIYLGARYFPFFRDSEGTPRYEVVPPQSLQSVLEPKDSEKRLKSKYALSTKAITGILNRAERQDKKVFNGLLYLANKKKLSPTELENHPDICFNSKGYTQDSGEVCPTLRSGGSRGGATPPAIYRSPDILRFLTEEECERLQGLPAGYTDIIHKGKKANKTVRYKAIGQGFSAPVVAWIGGEIKERLKGSHL